MNLGLDSSTLGASRGNSRSDALGRSPGSAPAAQRVPRAGWRDPRLWVGVAIVAVSVVAGARVLASADDTVPVWTAAVDLAAGAPLAAGDLEQHRVRFADADVLRDYYSGTESPPRGVLLRGVGAGELLPRAAVGTATQSGTVQVPLAVDPEQVPRSVGAGSVVDVYLLGDVEPALAAASVVDAPDTEDSFVVSGKRQLVLAVPEDDARRFFGLLGEADSPTLTVVGRA